MLRFLAKITSSLALLMLAGLPLLAQGAPQTSPATSPTPLISPTLAVTPSPEQKDATSLQEYREVLANERKLLEDQSKEYYSRVEKFAYLSLGALITALIGLIGFFAWMFGQTRREVVSQIKTELQTAVLSSARNDLEQFRNENIQALKSEYQRVREDLERFRKENVEAVNSEYQRLKDQLEQLGSFGKRQVIWLLTEAMEKPAGEIAALHSVGLAHVATTAPKVDSADEIRQVLENADLAIVTYDGSVEAKTLLRHAASALKFRQPPVSLLIYTYGFYVNDRPVQLDRNDLKLLKDLSSSFAPANFPATLVSQAQSLIIKARSMA